MEGACATVTRRYVDAATNMRGRQLVHRLRRLVPPRVLSAGTSGRPSGWRALALGAGVEAAPSSGPRQPPHVDGVFGAFGVERSAADPLLWTDSRHGLLFLFHLHGFQDLAAYAAAPADGAGDEFWDGIIRDWLSRCGKPAMPAWHPYPTSGRIIAWSAALSRESFLDELRRPMLSSMMRQLRTLRRAVEHDIGGNHVLRNAAALIIGGACLEDARTRARGIRLLDSELAGQVLPDGGHEERSPSYHRLILGDLLDVMAVLRRSGEPVPAGLTDTAARMDAWLRSLAGPSGDVPPLNDGWDGPALRPAGDPPLLQTLTPSGYVVLRDAAAQAVLDVGPVAPPHLPAHAHADVLSAVLWARGEPVLIDPGSGSYSGPTRDRFRGTAAHNTVQVDGEDQCDFWGPFRAAALPRVALEAVDRRPDGVVLVRARHDGYRRLRDPAVHERTFVWLGQEGMAVVDRLLSRGPHDVVSRLHFAEGIHAPLEAELPGGLRFSALTAGAVLSRAGERSPFLGAARPISVIELAARVRPGERFGWALTRKGVAVRLHGHELDVALPGRGELTVDLRASSADR